MAKKAAPRTQAAMLKDYGLKIQSESPLTLVSIDKEEGEILVGELAKTRIAIINREESEDTDGADFKDLKNMNDDDYVLVSADVNYADEFDFQEWTTMTVADLKGIVEKLKGYKDEIEWYFGTNEELQFSDGKDLLSQLTFRKITEAEFVVLDDLFGGSFDGGAGVFDHINELGDDEDSDDSDEDDSMFQKEDLKDMEKLKKFGWDVTVHNDPEYLVCVKNEAGEVSIAHGSIVYDLLEYHKRNK
jgi:hypothetical protein